MNRLFSSLHARAFSHATEELDRVKNAVLNAVGEAELVISKVEGHHGNPIDIVDAVVEKEPLIEGFFARFGREDIDAILETLDNRVDDACNLFVKVDKQRAYAGEIGMGAGDDVISVRVKIRAFPARPDVAKDIARRFLSELIATG